MGITGTDVSKEAAYMISTLLESNVSGGYANLMQILIDKGEKETFKFVRRFKETNY